MSDPKYMHVNGEIVPYAEAKIHVASPLAKYGIGVFEGLRAYWNDDRKELYVFRLREHLIRLKRSMKIIRFDDPFALEQLEDAVLSMIRANEFRTTIHMRVMAGLGEAGGDRVERGPVSLFVWGAPTAPHAFLKTGLRAGTSTWVRTSDNALPVRVKCNANYVNGRLAEMEALTNGYDRAVILNSRGKVSESPGATLFVIKDGIPITPGLTSEVLESITRDTLMRLLEEKMGLATAERDLDRTEIYAAEECFLCGSLAEVTPIVSLDGIQIGDGKVGPVTRVLQEHYLDQVHGRTQDHAEWLTPVYQTAKRSAA